MELAGNEIALSDRRVCVIGAGYVGLVTAAVLAESGREVTLVETNAERLYALRNGKLPIAEPGLEPVFRGAYERGLVRISEMTRDGCADAGVAIIAVGTPQGIDGGANLKDVTASIIEVKRHADPHTVIAIKSTVPPGTTVRLQDHPDIGRTLPLVACPEFLREGAALQDARNPDRVVVGGDNPEAVRRVAALFTPKGKQPFITDATSAEMIKYGANAFLAMKISFINEIAHLCDASGADIDAVADGVGADPRIGRAFLNAGVGFGGSCFPKDVQALDEMASWHGHSFWLLKAAVEINVQQRRRLVSKVINALGGSVMGKRIAVFGLAFKPHTDDVRESPALAIISHLEKLGAEVVATDPWAVENAQRILSSTVMMTDPYEAARDAHAIVVTTDWPEFQSLQWDDIGKIVQQRIVIDGRNCLNADRLGELGFTYIGMGRRSRMGVAGKLLGVAKPLVPA